MAPPLDWNPNGKYVFDDSIFDFTQMSSNMHVRRKRGGGGGGKAKSPEQPQDVVAKEFNSAKANTPPTPKGNSLV